MRYSFLIPSITLLIFSCFSCSQPQPRDTVGVDSLAKVQNESLASSSPGIRKYNFTDPKFILEEHKHKFHTGKIENFDHELLKRVGQMGNYTDSLYPVLDRESFDVFQSNEKVYDRIHEGTPYYFAVQHTGSYTGIIILQMNDGWVNEYIYMSYDPNGKLVGSAVLAGKGGDGGYGTIMTGEFVNDSVFVKKTIETEHDFEKEVDNIIVNATDEIIIHFNGKIGTRALK